MAGEAPQRFEWWLFWLVLVGFMAGYSGLAWWILRSPVVAELVGDFEIVVFTQLIVFACAGTLLLNLLFKRQAKRAWVDEEETRKGLRHSWVLSAVSLFVFYLVPVALIRMLVFRMREGRAQSQSEVLLARLVLVNSLWAVAVAVAVNLYALLG